MKMNNLQELHQIVEQAIEAARNRDKEKVEEIRTRFFNLTGELKDKGLAEHQTIYPYDLCINKCIYAAYNIGSYQENLEAAEEIFKQISKPDRTM